MMVVHIYRHQIRRDNLNLKLGQVSGIGMIRIAQESLQRSLQNHIEQVHQTLQLIRSELRQQRCRSQSG